MLFLLLSLLFLFYGEKVLVRYRLILAADENARQGKGSTRPECTAPDYAKLREKTNASKVKKGKKKRKKGRLGSWCVCVLAWRGGAGRGGKQIP